jgi:hypothetical protein
MNFIISIEGRLYCAYQDLVQVCGEFLRLQRTEVVASCF